MDNEIRNALRQLARCNRHIHTDKSVCAAREMTVPAIIAAAETAELECIVITNHHHYPEHDILADIAELKGQVENCRPSLQVLVGAELSALGSGTYVDTEEINRQVEFRLYACNHYHADFWQQPEVRSPRGYAEHQLATLRQLLPSGRADCIAHPFHGLYLAAVFEDTSTVAAAFTDDELGDIMQLGRKNDVAWEINVGSLLKDITFARRYLRIGMEIGADFKVGTDAHHLINVDPKDAVEELISRL